MVRRRGWEGSFNSRLDPHAVLDQFPCAAVATMNRGFRSIEMLAIKNQITIAICAINVT